MRAVRLLLAAAFAAAAAAQDTTCAVCVVLSTVLEQYSGDVATNPETSCQQMGFCDGSCTLFNGSWPVKSPAYPTDGEVIDSRRRLAHASSRSAPSAPALALDPAALARDPSARREAVTHAASVVRALQEESGRSLTLTEMLTGVAKYAAAAAASSTMGALKGPGVPNCQLLDIGCIISKVFDDHFPLVDQDLDAWGGDADESVLPFLTDHFRGASWRGRDCNDGSDQIYPGRKTNVFDATVDHNCNGIVGSSPNGSAWEDVFCSGANAPMGIAILGDSATAHFHLPPQYVNAASWNLTGVLELAANEADWPQCSWGTGFRDQSACPFVSALPANFTYGSIYSRLRARNLCMHRDLQNLGVNGARTGSMAPPGIVNALARDPVNDAPLLVIYSLIGNDVSPPCSRASSPPPSPRRQRPPRQRQHDHPRRVPDQRARVAVLPGHDPARGQSRRLRAPRGRPRAVGHDQRAGAPAGRAIPQRVQLPQLLQLQPVLGLAEQQQHVARLHERARREPFCRVRPDHRSQRQRVQKLRHVSLQHRLALSHRTVRCLGRQPHEHDRARGRLPPQHTCQHDAGAGHGGGPGGQQAGLAAPRQPLQPADRGHLRRPGWLLSGAQQPAASGGRR